MQAHKVTNQPVLTVITYNPEKVKTAMKHFPGLEVKGQFESVNVGDSDNETFIWVECPDEAITAKLGDLLRNLHLD